MDKATIQQMLTEHQAELQRVTEAAFRLQGAVAVLREQLRQAEEAEAESEADDGTGQ